MTLASLILLLPAAIPALPQGSQARTAADWDRIALDAGASFDTDAEMLAWIRALELEESDRRRRELGRLAGPRERLRLTLRHECENELEWLELSVDGSVLVTSDGTMRVWDAHTGEQLWTAVGKEPRFSANGRWLASAWQNNAQVFEARTGRLVGFVQTPPETEVHFPIPDSTGELLATTTGGVSDVAEDQLTLWDLSDGEAVVGPIPVGDQWPDSQAFDPTGRHFAYRHYLEDELRGGVSLWSRASGLRQLTSGPSISYSPIAFNRSGERLAVNVAGDAHFFDTASGEIRGEPLPLGYCDYHLAFRDDGALVAAGWGNSCVWDVTERRGVGVPRGQDGLESWTRDKYMDGPDDLSPDGNRYVLGGPADVLRVWSTETGVMLGGGPLLHGMQVDLAALAGDERTVASGNERGMVRVWDVPEVGSPTPPPPAFVESRIKGRDGGVRVSRHETTILLVEVATGEAREIQRGSLFGDLAFEADGAGLAVGWENGEIDVWSLEGERIAGPLRQAVHAFGLAWRGDRLLSVERGAIRCWDLTAGLPIGFMYSGMTPAHSQLDPSGAELIFCLDEYLERWSCDSWTRLGRIDAPEDARFLVVDSAGERVVLAGEDRLSLLDARSGLVIAETKVEDRPGYYATRFGSDGIGLLWEHWDDEEKRGTLWHWESEFVAPPRMLEIELDGGSDFVWHSGSKLLVYTSMGRGRGDGAKVHFVDLRDGNERAETLVLPGSVEGMKLDPTGEWLALSYGGWVEEDCPLSLATRVAGDPPVRELEAVIDDRGRLELRQAGTEKLVVHPFTHSIGHLVAIDRDGSPVQLLRSGRNLLEFNPMTGARRSLGARLRFRDEPWSFAIDAATGERAIQNDDEDVFLFEEDLRRKESRGFVFDGPPGIVALGGAGRWIATSRDEEVVVVELPPPREPLIVETDLGPATALALDRSGTRLAVGGQEGEVHFFELPSGVRREVELSFDRSVTALAFDEEGRLAVATFDGALRVIDDQGNVVEDLPPLEAPAAALAWIADGELVAVGRDGSYCSWSAFGELTCTECLLELGGPRVTQTAFDPTDTRLAIAYEDSSISVRGVEDWSLCGPAFRVVGTVRELLFGANSERLIVKAGGGYSTYDIATGTQVAGLYDSSGALWPSPPAIWVGRGTFEKQLYQVIDVESGEVLREVPWSARPMSKGKFNVWAGEFHPSGNRVLAGCTEYLTLLGIEDGVVTPLGTRRRPFGEETKLFSLFLEDGRVLAGVRMDRKPAELVILDFDDPGDVRLEGDASELRRLWEPRLGLTLKEGDIVRRRP